MNWPRIIAVFSLIVALASVLLVSTDLIKRPQHMWIMNIVWPLTALYGGPIAVWAYYRIGILSSRESVRKAEQRAEKMPGKKTPFWQSVAIATTHCGSGCTVGDICAEWLIFFVPLTLLGKTIFAAWVLDYVLAFLFGIAFQFFTIKPMRNLSTGQALGAALKADSLSLTSWQIGMYGWMAIAVFGIYGHELQKTDPVFWFMMQIAMICGFVTSYPINWWLLRKGVKEVM
jgi:hypothetical protein